MPLGEQTVPTRHKIALHVSMTNHPLWAYGSRGGLTLPIPFRQAVYSQTPLDPSALTIGLLPYTPHLYLCTLFNFIGTIFVILV